MSTKVATKTVKRTKKAQRFATLWADFDPDADRLGTRPLILLGRWHLHRLGLAHVLHASTSAGVAKCETRGETPDIGAATSCISKTLL
jgi:hypothetical protein